MEINIEKKLLRQVAEGNERAFRKLVFNYSGLLATYIFGLTKSKESTEEIVQDVFLKIWMSREVLAEVENFKGYLFIISRNYTLNALRRITREKMRQQLFEEYQLQSEKNISSEEIYPPDLIDKAIEQLPLQQRRVWLLSRKQRLTHQQIAIEMSLSKETVKKYIMYANQALIRFIKAALFLSIWFSD